MRQINEHRKGGYTTLNVQAVDQPAYGEPNRRYEITGFNTTYNPSARDSSGRPAQFERLSLIFQNGPLMGDMPQNGVTAPALLAAILDNLRGQQSGDSACLENQIAINHLEEALHALSMQVEIPYSSQDVMRSYLMG